MAFRLGPCEPVPWLRDASTPFKVMVVADDDDVARAIAHELGSGGHEVELAREPQSVMARLDADLADWDVVILDAGLPGTSGIDVLERFRELDSTASVIMLTGDRTAATTCMRAGAFHYVTKPFDPFELSTVVQAAARHSNLRRELAGVKSLLGAITDDDELTPLTEAKRRASMSFEKRYLTRVMEKAKGSVSEAARLAGLDRTNFRRLLQRHGLDPTTFK
jgi:DNA-binding NtrC family response regulator